LQSKPEELEGKGPPESSQNTNPNKETVGLSDTEEFDEECAWAPGSPTGHQGTDLMARKTARQSSPKLGDGKEHSLRGSPLARGSLEIPPHLKQITHEKVAKRTMQKVKKVAEMVEEPSSYGSPQRCQRSEDEAPDKVIGVMRDKLGKARELFVELQEEQEALEVKGVIQARSSGEKGLIGRKILVAVL